MTNQASTCFFALMDRILTALLRVFPSTLSYLQQPSTTVNNCVQFCIMRFTIVDPRERGRNVDYIF